MWYTDVQIRNAGSDSISTVTKNLTMKARNSSVSGSSDMIYPDLILNNEAIEVSFETPLISDKICSHCNMRIRGKVYEMNGKYYDSYCWQFRHNLQFKEKDTKYEREQKLFRDD